MRKKGLKTIIFLGNTSVCLLLNVRYVIFIFRPDKKVKPCATPQIAIKKFYNWCEIKTRMWLLNLGKPVNIPPLNEAMAIELGANLLGEGILFVVAAAILIIEYNRQSTKQAAKEKQQEDDMNRLLYQIQELSLQTEKQEAQLRELFRHVLDLDSKVVKLPWMYKNPLLDDENVLEQLTNEKLKSNVEHEDEGVLFHAINYVQKEIFRDTRKQPVERSL